MPTDAPRAWERPDGTLVDPRDAPVLIEVRRVDRCGATEWAVVHTVSGLICVGCCDTRKQAEGAKARLLALPISWGSYREQWIATEYSYLWGKDCEDGYWCRSFDEESMRLIAAEYCRVLGMDEPAGPASAPPPEQSSEQLTMFDAAPAIVTAVANGGQL